MKKDKDIAIPETVCQSGIQTRIYEIRGERVMLDCDLAELYGVATKVLNQAVKRNIERFPERYMFRLDNQEVANLRSQLVTTSNTIPMFGKRTNCGIEHKTEATRGAAKEGFATYRLRCYCKEI